MDNKISVLAIIVAVISLFLFFNSYGDLEAKDIQISELKAEISDLEEQLDEAKSNYEKEENNAMVLFFDAERMWKSDAFFCCTIKNDKYYHKGFYCFSRSEEAEELITSAYLIDDAKELGYTPCPICYGED